MLTVLNCIAYEHDLRLVGLAVVVCALATFTAISLLHHMQRSTGKSRLIWLAVSATTTGFGIWATHFIAMLAFSPGMPSGYNVALTSLSLVAAIVLTGVGFAVAVAPNLPASASIGGAIVGGGIRRCITPGWPRSKSRGTFFGIRCWCRRRLRSVRCSAPSHCPLDCTAAGFNGRFSARCC
jgi:Bacterial signalling protein N terminal repeat